MNRYKKIIGVFIMIPIVAIVCGAFLNILNPKKTARLRITVAPGDASIKIDNIDYQNNTLNDFTPGTHVATITLSGFKQKTVNLVLKDGQTTRLHEYLVPENGDLLFYEGDYDNLYMLREYLSINPTDDAVKAFITKYDQKIKILNSLPLSKTDAATGDFYYISSTHDSTDCKRIYCLEVGASTKDYGKAATRTIQDLGFNADDYQIIYHYDQ